MDLLNVGGFHIFVVRLHDFLQDAFLVVIVIDGEVAVKPLAGGIGHGGHHRFLGEAKFQHLEADRVERSHPAEIQSCIQEFLDTIFHFAGSLIGEGHRQNSVGFHIMAGDDMGNLVSDGTGLSRTCTSKNQHRTVDFLCGSGLFGIQFPVQDPCIHNICHKKLLLYFLGSRR